MITRYTLPEMGAIWSEENRFQKWLDVEIAVCDVHADMGTIPREAASHIKKTARFSVDRIREIERTTRHDVIAFTTALAENIGPESRYVHYGLTSSDVVDTANALLLTDAATLILEDLDRLGIVLRRRALEFKDARMIGRTHGVHAEPTTFGLVLALYYADNERNRERMLRAREGIRFGKLSGAVGTFAHLDPEVEERVCEKLALKHDPISTQVIQRDRYAEFLSTLAIIASSLEKIALEVRHLQRTEVREAEEPFAAGQKGSSAMPHKRNPVTAEQICGLARVVRANAQPGLENIALWHERDISHSSVERVVLPDSCILTDYMINRTEWLIDGLAVYPARMRANFESLGGVTSSGQVLLELTRKGVTREDAYAMVQPLAMKVWDEGANFRELIMRDPRITEVLSKDELDQIFNVEHQLRNVDKIFKRVFGE
ncbi:MAG TPA: adenylosuccinate lyase [Blastocatellia bacterium]|jgi:adenylosuccinate lyase|nr:adenylosuccinate lyase [Blastocatellia bacterium]